MSAHKIYFVSSNKFKVQEATEILKVSDVTVVPIALKLEELQTIDSKQLVEDKALKAFREIGRPLFVEHTGLHLAHLNGMPGGLTQIFWDSLEADRFCELFGSTSDTAATAETIIGYVDGRKIRFFYGKVEGSISARPSGDRAFQWDCVFVPKPYTSTFAELGPKKNDISMRRIALDEMSKYFVKADSV